MVEALSKLDMKNRHLELGAFASMFSNARAFSQASQTEEGNKPRRIIHACVTGHKDSYIILEQPLRVMYDL